MNLAVDQLTRTGGRSATTRHIPPILALSVGMPTISPPKGWKWVELTKVARLESGHTPSRNHPEYWGGDIPWIGIVDARVNHGRRIYETLQTTNALGIANSSARVLPEGTVCLSRTASVGYVVVMGKPMATSQDFVNWVCSDALEPNYLRYLFIAEGDDLLRFASGSVHSTIYFPEAKAFHIAMPPLAEQRRIVGILDEAFSGLEAMRANAERNVANASELFEAELESVLKNTSPGWRQTRIGDIADTQYGLSLPMNTEGTGFKIFRMGEVQNGRLIDTGRMKHVDISHNEFSAYKLKPGDVLFNRTNSYELVGKTGIFDLEGDYCFASYLIRLIVRDQRIDTRLLNYIMNTSRFQEQVKRKAAKSVNQANINATILSNEIIKFPIDRSEQLSIVEGFDAFKEISENLENSYRSKLRMVDELKKSLLHQAFSGNL